MEKNKQQQRNMASAPHAPSPRRKAAHTKFQQLSPSSEMKRDCEHGKEQASFAHFAECRPALDVLAANDPVQKEMHEPSNNRGPGFFIARGRTPTLGPPGVASS